MGKLRINRLRKCPLKCDDPFRNLLKLLEVSLRVPLVRGAVADDGQTLLQGVGKFAEDGR